MNTNKEQTEEEVVVIGAKQPLKKKKQGKTICIEMAKKEIDKPSQVGEFQMSLITTIVMLGVGKEWEDIAYRFLVAVKTTQN